MVHRASGYSASLPYSADMVDTVLCSVGKAAVLLRQNTVSNVNSMTDHDVLEFQLQHAINSVLCHRLRPSWVSQPRVEAAATGRCLCIRARYRVNKLRLV